jgi:hypothetical protein
MRGILIVSAVAACAALAGCSQTEKGAGFGALAGGTVGAIATGTPEGAIVGAAVGAGTGALIGAVADQPGYCYYRDRYGRRYTDRC